MITVEHAPRTKARTLAAELEARRLEHRVRRVRFVLDALEERKGAYARRGSVPVPLVDSITEFSRRLQGDRRRLAELRGSDHDQGASA